MDCRALSKWTVGIFALAVSIFVSTRKGSFTRLNFESVAFRSETRQKLSDWPQPKKIHAGSPRPGTSPTNPMKTTIVVVAVNAMGRAMPMVSRALNDSSRGSKTPPSYRVTGEEPETLISHGL